jgi:kynurenine formamidase
MLYDITPPVSPDLAVWPGDTSVTREVLCDLANGDSVTLSTLRATVHLGAHADGPNHYGVNAPSVGERDLHYYIGPCLFDSKDLPAHRRFLANDMAILETLLLRDVPEGMYELIAPPLKLMGFDGSPVRAVLRTLPPPSP